MNNKFPRVTVLLSTYNGDKYIGEQLNSLLNQTYNNFNILIRDDGSSDNTLNILELYEKRYHLKISIIKGTNVGVIKSFFELIEYYKGDSSYIAFCDQDDFWEPLKIEKSVSALEASKVEIKGYCSNLKLVDENLNFIIDKYKKTVIPDFHNALFENIVTGCTFVASNELILLLKNKFEHINLSNILMHDWFLYILGSAFGEIIYDEKSYIQYRQHSNNVIGMDTNFISTIKRRFRNIYKYKNKRVMQIKEFYFIYKLDLSVEKKVYLEKLINSNNFIKRMKFVYEEKVIRQNKFDSLITKIMILFKIY